LRCKPPRYSKGSAAITKLSAVPAMAILNSFLKSRVSSGISETQPKMIAVVISDQSQNPVIAASISTISGLVIGFAASNLIGNVIAVYIWQ
jgi:hypothetical protein